MPKYFRIFKDDAYSRHTGQLRQNLTPYEQLEKYKDNPDVYISFRSIEKIGINPQSEYDTPNGIYTYPLKAIWKEFDHDKKEIDVPFAQTQPYLYVVESVGEGIKNLSKYSKSDLKKDIEKLKNKYSDNKEDIDDLLDDSEGDKPYEIIWNVTKGLSEDVLSGKPANTWNLILNKTLGYNYVCDLKGEGIIHPNEPIQAVFFNTKCFKTLDIIDNLKQALPAWVLSSKNKPLKFSFDKNDDFIWENGTWNKGVWRQGIFQNGTFKGGIFKGDIWKGGKWIDGTWEDGIWRQGWIYDPDKKGNFEPDWKWENDFVRSTINPDEYFKGKNN